MSRDMHFRLCSVNRHRFGNASVDKDHFHFIIVLKQKRTSINGALIPVKINVILIVENVKNATEKPIN